MRRLIASVGLALLAVSMPHGASAQIDTRSVEGRWGTRTFIMRITHDGHAFAQWRLNIPCSEGPERPCDLSIDAPGGVAAMTFTALEGPTLIGTVDWSTSDTLIQGPLTVTFNADGTASVRQGQGGIPLTLCGPRSSTATRIEWCAGGGG